VCVLTRKKIQIRIFDFKKKEKAQSSQSQRSQHQFVAACNSIKKKSMRILPILLASMSTFNTTLSSEISQLKKMSEIMQVKKLSEFAIIPVRGSEYAAGNDNNNHNNKNNEPFFW
jgi:hypothetical protein